MTTTAEESRVNPYFLNQAGQDTVQDIACKAQEIFQVIMGTGNLVSIIKQMVDYRGIWSGSLVGFK